MTEGDLAVVAVRATEFEAATLVAILQDEGIPAAVSNNAPSWTGQMSISPTSRGASVLVREDDLERAREILARRESDSVDLDWDEVDVGERADDVQSTEDLISYTKECCVTRELTPEERQQFGLPER